MLDSYADNFLLKVSISTFPANTGKYFLFHRGKRLAESRQYNLHIGLLLTKTCIAAHSLFAWESGRPTKHIWLNKQTLYGWKWAAWVITRVNIQNDLIRFKDYIHFKTWRVGFLYFHQILQSTGKYFVFSSKQLSKYSVCFYIQFRIFFHMKWFLKKYEFFKRKCRLVDFIGHQQTSRLFIYSEFQLKSSRWDCFFQQ